MYYYTIEIPRHENGDIAVYPPNWFGVMRKCPQNVTVKIFNDKEGYGIAETPDKVTQKELTVLDEVDALTQLSAVKDEEDVYIGDKLLTRWDAEVFDGK